MIDAPRRRSQRWLASYTAALLASVVALFGNPLQAHPHAWIDLRVSITFDAAGGLARLHQEWLFDPSYSLLLLHDWERMHPGHSLDSALQQLGDQLVTQLRAYDYFTELRLAGTLVSIPDAVAGPLTLRRDRLNLQFALALDLPRPRADASVEYRIFDPSYWIEILHDPDDVIHLAGGMGCLANLKAPQPTPGLIRYAATLDRDQRAPVPDLGRAFAQTVRLSCLP